MLDRSALRGGSDSEMAGDADGFGQRGDLREKHQCVA